MPLPTPFYARTAALCESHRWKDWAGYHAVSSYDTCHEQEYLAFRYGAGLIDVTPLFKYDVIGKDAAKFLSFATVKNVSKLKPGRMTYCCWCDADGKVLDDGTIANLGEDRFRVTSADPSFAWFASLAQGFDVEVKDVTDTLGALSLQGPKSREVLRGALSFDIDELKFFGVREASYAGVPIRLSRTGYTGDLGYEIWVENSHALTLWDALLREGKQHGLEPAGLDAMDVTRIEAGFILLGVDYRSARTCLLEEQKSSPFEIGLDWCVQLHRDPFIGQEALLKEKAEGSKWAMVGLDIDWDALESLYAGYGLPPQICSSPWRGGIPLYRDGVHIGQATSGSWAPILKKNLAIGQIHCAEAQLGNVIEIEHTVEFQRRRLPARIVKTPFFDPPRKRS